MADAYAIFMAQALKLIEYAYNNYPESLTITPPQLMKVKREKGDHPATMTCVIPDRVAAKLKSENNKDLMYIVWVREEVLERAQSDIVLPGEH